MLVNDFSPEVEALKGVLERLDYLAMDALREFMASNDQRDKDTEKRIHKARRAIIKAISELGEDATD
ncbi:MAG: hypothetical protein EPN30_10265 [Actinomycetota bacterium]|nr:MAG: hypothetical protein EPN30_10265 [Actinomycetota bacterium]